MKTRAEGVIRVNIYRLVEDGIEGPLRHGIRRAFKHDGPGLSDEQIERLVDAQSHELLNWFCETFRFDEENDGD